MLTGPARDPRTDFESALTPILSFQNLMYVAQTGQLIARHRTSWLSGSSGGDLSCLQLPGVNNYQQLWADRRVYGEADA